MLRFSTERINIENIKKHKMVFIGDYELLTKIFVGKKSTMITALEAKLSKYMHNVLGAYNVTYFKVCCEYC